MKTKKHTCKICDSECTILGRHLLHHHNITNFKNYYDQYIKIGGEGICLSCGNCCSFLGLTLGYSKYCSTVCSNNSEQVQQKKKDSCKENFGVDHPLQSVEIRERFIQTSIDRNGVSNPSKSQLIKDKKLQTNKEHWGTENPMQSKKIQKKQIQTMISRHGVEYPMQSKEIKEQTRQTNEERYGGPSPMCSDIVQKKTKLTNEERYSGPSPMCSETVQKKAKKTCFDHLGVNYPGQSKVVQEKAKHTCKETWGVENPSQSEAIKVKKIQTCFENWGVDSPMQSDKIQNQFKKTMMNRYGYDNPFKCREFQDKSKYSNILKFGVDHWTKSKEGKIILRENMIRQIMSGYKDGSIFSPSEGIQERMCFDELQLLCSYSLLKNQTFIGLFPDRYIKDLNLIIEFYEDWHKYSWCLTHDINRQKELMNKLDCNFFIIREKDWKENKEETIQNFLCVIRGLEDIKRLQDTL